MTPPNGETRFTEPIRIVLADDHAVVRSGLRLLFEGESDFEVVAEASDIESARRFVRGYHPTVLVLDLNMPDGSSLQAIPTILEESPGTRIVVLTMQQELTFARRAIAAGALGYVLKDAVAEEVVEAVRGVAVGESYLDPRLGARMASEPSPGPRDGLSQREIDVLRLIALGHTNIKIAERLYLSVRTVESHRAHIQRKLGLSTRADLVELARIGADPADCRQDQTSEEHLVDWNHEELVVPSSESSLSDEMTTRATAQRRATAERGVVAAFQTTAPACAGTAALMLPFEP